LLVVAVKKEVLEEYAAVLAACGVTPLFTLAALARAELYPAPSGSGAVLDIGRAHSEWMSFDNGAPASIRIVSWGGETLSRLMPEEPDGGPKDDGKPGKTAALAALMEGVKPGPAGGRLYLTGEGARDPRLAPLLTGVLGGAVSCESLLPPPGAAPSAAIAGLVKSAGANGASPPLILELDGGHEAVRPGPPVVWKWAAAAVLLGLAALFFPYAEAVLLKPSLEKKLAALEADRGRLATIDQELDFLKFLKQSQPPYLDTIYLLARSAPQGAHLDGVSLNRHQEISIRLKMGSAQQVSDFRSKLIESGWFTNVMVEEQTPSPDRRVTVRMTAELRSAESRKPIAAEPPGKKTDVPSLAGSGPDFGMPPPVMMAPPQPVPASPARRGTPPPRSDAPPTLGGTRITLPPGGQPMPMPMGGDGEDD
jgi:hypothetical protein